MIEIHVCRPMMVASIRPNVMQAAIELVAQHCLSLQKGDAKRLA